MAYSGTRDRRREKEKGSEEGEREREPSTPRSTEPLKDWITAGNGTLGQKDSTAKRCGEKKASGLVTTQGARRGKGEEGCTKGKATDPTGCRAFSDVVERSETIGTKKKKAPKIRLGVAPGQSRRTGNGNRAGGGEGQTRAERRKDGGTRTGSEESERGGHRPHGVWSLSGGGSEARNRRLKKKKGAEDTSRGGTRLLCQAT